MRHIEGFDQLDPVTQGVATVLESLGVVFPGPVDPALDHAFPGDLTDLGMQELGQEHSYWISQFARMTAVHGVIVAQKRSLKFTIARQKAALGRLGASNAMLEGALERNQAALSRVEAADAILAGNAEAHKRYVEACSREITRRQIEANLSR